MNVNLKLLQTFLLVADHGSFRKAAEDANRTPSAVSSQIRQLEEQLGLPLFHRTTRKVQLTLEGQQLHIKARDALASVSEGLLQLQQAVNSRRSMVTMASSPTIASSRLPGVLQRFERTNPQVMVRVRELPSVDMFVALKKGEVDFCVGPYVGGMSDFQFEPLARDEVCALIPLDHRLARRRRVSIADLAGEPTIMLSAAAELRRRVEEVAQAFNVHMLVKYEVLQPHTVASFASSGLGIAILPRIAISAASARNVRILPLTNPAIEREICIIKDRSCQLSAPALALTGLLREALRASGK